MHYKNGREAKAGDPVIKKDYNGNIQVGILLDMIPASHCCNATLLRPAGMLPFEVKTDQCVHAEDGWTALNPPPQEPVAMAAPVAAPSPEAINAAAVAEDGAATAAIAAADVQAGIAIGG